MSAPTSPPQARSPLIPSKDAAGRSPGPSGLSPTLVAEVAALRGEVRGLGAEVRALGGEVRRQARTDWPAVLTAGGLAATLLAGLGALALDPLKAEAARARSRATLRAEHHAAAVRAVGEDVQTLTRELRAHAAAGSHPVADARLDALERAGRP